MDFWGPGTSPEYVITGIRDVPERSPVHMASAWEGHVRSTHKFIYVEPLQESQRWESKESYSTSNLTGVTLVFDPLEQSSLSFSLAPQ